MEISIRDVITEKDLKLFWEVRNQYMEEDIIPNASMGEPFSSEDIDWFFSKEYKEHIMKLYRRQVDKLHIVFFVEERVYIGFAVYVTYHSEDGKCFILDFCIFKNFRNQGLGKECFELLKEREKGKGASYFALNLSNDNNKRFWTSLGFKKTELDEYGNYIYVLNTKKVASE